MNDQATVPTAIVTGGARGIGASISQRLAKNGVRVAVLDLKQEDCETVVSDIKRDGGNALPVAADVTDEDSVQSAVEQVNQDLGAPNILVNNAGVIRDNMLFKMSINDWETVMAVHLRGAFLMSRACQSHMVEQQWGRIINLSSASAQGNRGQVNYAAAKAGIQGFTKTLSLELGKFGVTANAIAPGFIATDMTRATAERLGVSFEEFLEMNAKQIPVARVGQPEDVASTAAFLASNEAGFISGQVIYVAGGPLD
jgi:3-oxoacyl-[acyl-carrier protein] reductase